VRHATPRRRHTHKNVRLDEVGVGDVVAREAPSCRANRGGPARDAACERTRATSQWNTANVDARRVGSAVKVIVLVLVAVAVVVVVVVNIEIVVAVVVAVVFARGGRRVTA
jgi:hypothetical protein